MMGGAQRRLKMGLVLRGAKSYVDVVIGTSRKVSFVDRGTFGLKEEIVSARAKPPMFGDELNHRLDNTLTCFDEG